jgi:hypothetical protein
MTPFQTDDFMTKLLQGAFDKWQPSSYWWSFWRKKLEQIDFDEAKAALALYAENKTKTETDPTWQRFADYLKQVAIKPKQEDSGTEVYLIAQCYSHRIPAYIGAILYSRYKGTQEQEAIEQYQIELARGKGGFWQAYIAYGLDELREARREMVPKRNVVNNHFLNLGYRKYSLDFRRALERDYHLDEFMQETMPATQPQNWQSLSGMLQATKPEQQEDAIEELVF